MKLIYSVQKFDVYMFTCLINAGIYRYLAIISRYISRTGDGHLYVLMGIFLYATEGLQSLFLNVTLLAFLIERPVYFLMKNGFKRDRPQIALKGFHSQIKPSDQFSFPSGHTSASFMVATITSFFIPAACIPMVLWAALVGFSRVVLGVHFPTDILVGMALGVSVAIFSLSLLIV